MSKTRTRRSQGPTLYRRIRHELSKTPLRRPLVWYRHTGLTHADVALASYPRSGSTWLRFLLFELLTGTTPEFGEIDDPNSPVGNIGNQSNSRSCLRDGARIIKTHHQFRRSWKRAIYLVRDPRDIVVSEYKYLNWMRYLSKDFDGFVGSFVSGGGSGYGSWGDHVRSWVASYPGGEGLLIVKYEDLRTQPEVEIERIVGFLGLKTSPEAVERAIEHNSLSQMKNREDDASDRVYSGTSKGFRFVNQGKISGWRDHLGPEHARIIESTWKSEMERFEYLAFD